MSPADADHVSIEEPAISFLTFEELPSDRYFVILSGWSEGSDGLKPGAKGELLVNEGRRGALFRVVGVDENDAVGAIVEYKVGRTRFSSGKRQPNGVDEVVDAVADDVALGVFLDHHAEVCNHLPRSGSLFLGVLRPLHRRVD